MADVDSTYKKTLVTYVDVLGFADLIEKSRRHEPTIAKIADLLEEIKALSSLGATPWSPPERSIFHSFKFSDLLVRTTEIATDLTKLVDWELFYLATLQMSFAEGGVLIRGGICVGDLFVSKDKTVVFGPALVKSYKLESEFAVYPRIVIDRDLRAQLVPKQNRGVGWEEFVDRGEDGAYFLDYLFGRSLYSTAGAILGADPEPEPGLEAHKNMILGAVKDIQERRETHERIKQKYMWLALYHNRTVDRLQARLTSELSEKIDKFRIPADSLSF